jgi:hypothetical protein
MALAVGNKSKATSRARVSFSSGKHGPDWPREARMLEGLALVNIRTLRHEWYQGHIGGSAARRLPNTPLTGGWGVLAICRRCWFVRWLGLEEAGVQLCAALHGRQCQSRGMIGKLQELAYTYKEASLRKLLPVVSSPMWRNEEA